MSYFYKYEIYFSNYGSMYTDGEAETDLEALMLAEKSIKASLREGPWKVEIIECRPHMSYKYETDKDNNLKVTC